MRKEKSSALAAINMLSALRNGVTNQRPDPAKITGETYKMMPAGCKKYWFNIDGLQVWPSYMGDDTSYDDWKDGQEGIVFTCIASNEKNAVRKFTNWKKQQP